MANVEGKGEIGTFLDFLFLGVKTGRSEKPKSDRLALFDMWGNTGALESSNQIKRKKEGLT